MSFIADRTVAVVGGGIGGLTSALALAQQGARVTVYEQASALTEVGAGLQISPNGARVLDALGLDADSVGLSAEAVQPMAGLTGRTLARFNLLDQKPPYRFFHRHALIVLLADACADLGVRASLGSRIDDPSQLDAEVIVGADGLRSTLRSEVTGRKTDPFFTGQVAWRAIVPDTGSDPVARIWMAPGKHVVTYPLSGGALNIVAVQERSAWASEGWAHEDDPSAVRAAFADCCGELKSILHRIEKVHLWGLFRHPVVPRLSKNNVVLVGDAAHPTLPFLAQGANLALEDGFVLAACLAQNESLRHGLAAYQKARLARVTRAINAANANARNYHLGGVRATFAHAGLRTISALAPNVFLNRLSWLYDHDVTAPNYQFAAV